MSWVSGEAFFHVVGGQISMTLSKSEAEGANLRGSWTEAGSARVFGSVSGGKMGEGGPSERRFEVVLVS